MRSPALLQVLCLSLIAIPYSGSANPLIGRDAGTCGSPISVSSSSVTIGNNTVTLDVLACTVQLQADGLLGILCPILGLFCPPKPRPVKHTSTVTIVKPTTITETDTETVIATVTQTETDTDTITATLTITASPSPTPTATDVCGLICNTFCSDLGQLPPISDDCQVIKDSIQIFEGNSAPTFIVQPAHIQQLTFGTCRFFFENLGTVPLEYCWQDLANTGSVAATQCFPPTNPVNSLAVCEAPDSTWEVGVSHS